eukprot:3756682-Prymnesium_polylepis.1
MCRCPGVGHRMCTVMPACCGSRWDEHISCPRPVPPATTEAMRMTHAVAAWPPEPARGCCGGVRRPRVCLPRVSVAVSVISSCRALPSHVSGTRP